MIDTLVAGGPVLRGVCNQCGLCCFETLNGQDAVCAWLTSDNPKAPIGQAHATRCRVYDDRRDGMMIAFLDVRTRKVVGFGQCGKDSDAETRAIIAKGIGRGCSLEVVA